MTTPSFLRILACLTLLLIGVSGVSTQAAAISTPATAGAPRLSAAEIKSRATHLTAYFKQVLSLRNSQARALYRATRSKLAQQTQMAHTVAADEALNKQYLQQVSTILTPGQYNSFSYMWDKMSPVLPVSAISQRL